MVRNLYWIGALGQAFYMKVSKSKYRIYSERWVYRGDYDFDPDTSFVLHRALWPELKLDPITRDCFQLGSLFAEKSLPTE
jgi:hypothetical protein